MLLWINLMTHWIIWNDSYEPHAVIMQTQDSWLMSNRTFGPHRNIQILLTGDDARQRTFTNTTQTFANCENCDRLKVSEEDNPLQSINPRLGKNTVQDICYSDFTMVMGLKLQSDVSSITKCDCKNSDPKITLQLL